MSPLTLPLVLFLALAGPALAQRAPDMRLDTMNPAFAASSTNAKVSVGGDNVYVVWQDNRASGGLTDDIYFNRSLDGGKTWLTTDVRIDTAPGSVYSLDPVIASFGDHVFVAWTDGRDFPSGASIYYARSLDAGTTWSANVRLDVALGSGSSHPRISNDGDVVCVVWFEANAPTSIQYATSATSGDPGTWTTPISVSGTASATYPPSIAVSGTKAYVAWSATVGSGYANIHFNRTTTAGTGGGFFMTPLVLDSQPPAVLSGHSSRPRVACTGDEVYVVWDDGRDGPLGSFNRDIYFQKSVDGGVTFLASDVRLDVGSAAGAANSGTPSLALGLGVGPTKVYVAWEDVRSGFSDVYFIASQDGGATWPAADTRLDTASAPGARNAFLPELAASGASVAGVWKDEVSFGSAQVYAKASFDGGLTWGLRDVKLNTGAGASTNTSRPAIAVETPSKFHVAWEDLRSGSAANWDIYTTAWERCLKVVSAPGVSTFSLDVKMDAFLPYAGAASFGYLPGIPLSNRTVPLNFDALTVISLDPAYAAIFTGFSGVLDAAGHAGPAIVYPPGSPTGLPFYVAFVTLDLTAPDSIRTLTEAVMVTIP
jgi:hypothetical protein